MANGTSTVKGSRFTKDEISLLAKLYPARGSVETAMELGRSIASTRGKACRLGLRTDRYYFWTKAETEKLAKLFPNCTTQEVAKQLGRSLSSTINKAFQMGLKKRRNGRTVRN